MLRGKPITSRSAPDLRYASATSCAVFSLFQDSITLVCPVSIPSVSETATPVRASPRSIAIIFIKPLHSGRYPPPVILDIVPQFAPKDNDGEFFPPVFQISG